MKKIMQDYELDYYTASWMMTQVCNYNCCYCTGKVKGHIPEPLNVDAITRTLRETGKKWTVAMTGGEPFIYPNFIDLCVELTQNHNIAIDTNLSVSHKVREFAEVISPDSVAYIYISTHIEERERVNGIQDFINNYKLLFSKGFNLCANYVLHPKLIYRFIEDFKFLKSNGIEVYPKPFVGIFENKVYPNSYSRKEIQLLRKFNYRASSQTPFYSKGLLCNAGKNLIRILEDGTVTRCAGDKSLLGNIYTGLAIYDKPKPCKQERCTCFGSDLLAESKYSKFSLSMRRLFEIILAQR